MGNRHVENKQHNKKEDLKQDNFLLYVPKKKHNTWEIRKGKVYLIFYHTKLIEKFVRWLVKKSNISDIALDELGSTIWILIDGKATVYEIGKKLEEKFGDSCQPVYERLILYIRYLNRRGWISFERGLQEVGIKDVEKAKDAEIENSEEN